MFLQPAGLKTWHLKKIDGLHSGTAMRAGGN